MNKKPVEELLKKYGQEHLLQFWDELNDDKRTRFAKELLSIDFERVKKLADDALQELKNTQSENLHSRLVKKDENLEPLPTDVVGKISTSSQEQIDEWNDAGLKQISEGAVGVVLLAGGQGTRLGVSYPKGMYNVGLPSAKTLYQLQAERVKKVQNLAKAKFGTESNIRWYIMTSDATLKETKKFFEANDHFGLEASNVIFFEQYLLPCLTFEGKMMLSSKASLAQSPDGNGGLYRALKSTNMLKDFEDNGIKHIYVYCVDNILVKVADPVFIGFCAKKNLECGNKVIEKVEPNEAVGVVCKIKDKYQVVEYSEILPTTAEKRKEDGSLMFNASNICIHYFSTDFLHKICSDHLTDLPHHIAKKKIPHIDESGKLVTPTSPNGMKLEKFVFDVFPFSSKFGVLEGERFREFSPLKNGPSSTKSSPISCRADLLYLHYRYLKDAGATYYNDDGLTADETTSSCELSPLLSYAGEGLHEFRGKKLCIGTPTHLEPLTNSPTSKKSKKE